MKYNNITIPNRWLEDAAEELAKEIDKQIIKSIIEKDISFKTFIRKERLKKILNSLI